MSDAHKSSCAFALSNKSANMEFEWREIEIVPLARREGKAWPLFPTIWKRKQIKKDILKKKNPSQKDKNFNLKTSKMALLLHVGQQ